MFTKAWYRVLAVGVAGALVAAACGNDDDVVDPEAGDTADTADAGSADAEGTPSGSVTIPLQLDWDTLDPRFTVGRGGVVMSIYLYDRLLDFTQEGELIPQVAEDWEVAPDGRSVEFTIRDGVTCQDGTPLTPTAIAQWLRAFQDPGMGRPARALFGSEDNLQEVTADDDARTLTISLREPFSDMLIQLAALRGGIICPAGLDDPDAVAQEPFGSGPFVLEDRVRGDSYTFRVRPEYAWGSEGTTTAVEGFPETVTLKVITQESTAANLFLGGDLDAVEVAGQDRARVEGAPGVASTVSLPTSYVRMFIFNGRSERVTSDIAVRKALASAVDRQVLADIISSGVDVQLATGSVESSQPYYEPATEDALQPFDPDGARQVLEDAGYSLGESGFYERDGQPLEVEILAPRPLRPANEFLLNSFEDIGVDASLNAVDPATFSEELPRGEWDVALNNPVPSFTPGNLDLVHKVFAGWDNPEADQAKDAAWAAVTEDEKAKAWSEALLAWMEDVNFVPIYEVPSAWFSREGFEFETGPTGEIEIMSMRLR